MQTLQELTEKLLREGLDTGCYPSACAALGQGDKVLAEACVGEIPLPGGMPADRHTRYDMASISKIVGPTMIALQAIESGKLRLTDTLGDYFDAPADKRGITVKMLMTHTAGLVPTFRLDQAGIGQSEIADCILRHPLQETPGKRPIYSCMGFILLAKILEKLYGKTLDQLAADMVFAPLGLKETAYGPCAAPAAATENDPDTGRPFIGVVHDENARFQNGVSGNAGVFMSLHDAEIFCRMLSAMGAPLIRRETMEAAIHNYTPEGDDGRGLGFQVLGRNLSFMGGMPLDTFGHTGFTGTSVAVEPKTGFWAILLSNRVCPTRENVRLMPFRRKFHTQCWQAMQETI